MNKTITIKGVEYTLKPGFKAMIIFEKITDGAFKIKTTTDILVYIYSSILAGTKDTSLDLEEMIDAFDEEPELLDQAMSLIMPESSLDKVVRLSNEEEGGPEPKKE